jgi:transposase-like protein
MSEVSKSNPEVQPKPERRRFTAEYKRRIVAEAEQCQYGELGSLLRREGEERLS